MSVEFMINVPPPPPPPPSSHHSGGANKMQRPKFSSMGESQFHGPNGIVPPPPPPLLDFNNTNGNKNLSVLLDEIKSGVKLKKCPSPGRTKDNSEVKSNGLQSRSPPLDGNSDNQVGDNKDPKMVSVQAELLRRLQRRNEGIDDDAEGQKILSPTLALFVQNKTKPLKREESEDDNSPKMISHGKRNFCVSRKNILNGASNSLQTSPNSSEMDLSSEKSLSHSDLTVTTNGNEIQLQQTESKPVVEVEKARTEELANNISVKHTSPVNTSVVYSTSVPYHRAPSNSFVNSNHYTPYVSEKQPVTKMHAEIKPLIMKLSSENVNSPIQNHSPSPKEAPELHRSASTSPPLEHYSAVGEKHSITSTSRVSELCKNYGAENHNTNTTTNKKVNDTFVHLNGNLTLKRPKELPKTHQKISHGKPNYVTQSSTLPRSAVPKSPIIHKTELHIEPTFVNHSSHNHNSNGDHQSSPNKGYLSFSRELSSPNRYTDKVTTPKPETNSTNKTLSANIAADLQQRQFIKDLIVDDLLEVKDIKFSIDPQHNDLTIDLKIGMHLNPKTNLS